MPKGKSYVASFDRKGDFLYTGNQKGRVTIIDMSNLKVVASFQATNGSANVMAIEFAMKGKWAVFCSNFFNV